MWAKISNDGLTVLRFRTEDMDPAETLMAPVGGKPYWLPVVEQFSDTSTGDEVVDSGWVETIEADRVLRTRTIRDKNAEELDADDTAMVDGALVEHSMVRALLGWVFDAENRLRVLEGQPTITLTQFKAAVKARIR